MRPLFYYRIPFYGENKILAERSEINEATRAEILSALVFKTNKFKYIKNSNRINVTSLANKGQT